MIRLSIAILLLAAALPTEAQTGYHYISFNTKRGTPYQLSKPEEFLSPKAVSRRKFYKIAIDSTDLPVNPAFVDSLKKAGAKIINTSRWMNHALIQTTDEEVLARINAFSFVAGSGRLSRRIAAPEEPEGRRADKFPEVVEENSSSGIQPRILSNQLNYGNNYPQISIHDGEFLHNRGFTGHGMTIAVLDAGFSRYKTNPVFDSLRQRNRILMEWDFINNEASVNEDHSHGSYCLSILAANSPGIMIGTAPHADYLLFRTENVATEFPVEEQAWLVAAEKADSVGADMISSSLGYVDFDDPAFNHGYAQRDGKTSLITRAANTAARKGILVMNSAGNYGTQPNDKKYVSCPADGDSVFAVGATNAAGTIASFSSWGPAYGGKTKPNAVSVGEGTVLATLTGGTTTSNGTSFSNPNLAGLILCLWQAFPEFSNMEIMDVVQKSADRFQIPDERYGYGIPDFRKAYQLLSSEKEKKTYQQILGKNNIKAYPVPFDNRLQVSFQAQAEGTLQVRLLDIQGKALEAKKLSVVRNAYYTIEFENTLRLASGVYYLQTDDGTQKHMIPVIRR